MIKERLSTKTIDQLQRLPKQRAKRWLAQLETRERERHRVSKTCSIKYNKVFGYYLEVTNSYKDLRCPTTCDAKADAGQRGALYPRHGLKRAGGYDSWMPRTS